MLAPLILPAALAVAYANGANANFKGVASLYGSGTTSYQTALRWSTFTTTAGCVAALAATNTLLQTFSGKGLVPDALAAQPAFLFATALGGALANWLATRLGFPVSTTHMLMGGLLGAGLAADPACINFAKLWDAFAMPLLLAPVLALVVGALLYWLLKTFRLAPDHRTRMLDALHFLSAGAVCFARGMNDTPKIAALIIGEAYLGTTLSLLLVAASIAIGGVVSSRQVAETLSHKITGMNPGQGFTANLTTAVLVLFGTLQGLPLSTTHVTVGSLLGIGISTRQTQWRTVLPVLAAWLITLPCAALLSASVFLLCERWA